MIEYYKNLSLENLFYIDENGIVQEEEWFPILFIDEPYEISNLLRVKKLPREVKNKQSLFMTKERIISPWLSKSKYYSIKIKTKGKNTSFLFHRIVAQAFIPNPENKPQVNHINGIKTDNRIENLEWVTGSENVQHALKTGLLIPFKGENHPSSKLTELQVLEIRKLKKSMTQKEIGKLFGVKYQVIGNILRNEIWKHV
ncbi:MAG TPA: NUMOD4 motif-containing HNH endonuclease [Flavobacterium lutivivi]|nr:NUMOD4 motif-containing HNH endonuclease [Flavobacterium lutivivi]